MLSRASLLLFVTLAFTIGCSRNYDSVPTPYHGKWKADQINTTVGADIDNSRIVLFEEDGRTRTCRVKSVSVHSTIFSKGKRTIVRCATPDKRTVELAYRICSKNYPREYFRWSLELIHDDSEIYDPIEILEVKESCETWDSTNGHFFHQ